MMKPNGENPQNTNHSKTFWQNVFSTQICELSICIENVLTKRFQDVFKMFSKCFDILIKPFKTFRKCFQNVLKTFCQTFQYVSESSQINVLNMFCQNVLQTKPKCIESVLNMYCAHKTQTILKRFDKTYLIWIFVNSQIRIEKVLTKRFQDAFKTFSKQNVFKTFWEFTNTHTKYILSKCFANHTKTYWIRIEYILAMYLIFVFAGPTNHYKMTKHIYYVYLWTLRYVLKTFWQNVLKMLSKRFQTFLKHFVTFLKRFDKTFWRCF